MIQFQLRTSLIAAESKIRLQLQRVLGTDPESDHARQDIKSLRQRLDTTKKLLDHHKQKLKAAEEKWKTVSAFLRQHGINPDGWELKLLPPHDDLPPGQAPASP